MANPVVHFEVPVRKAKLNKVRRFYEDVFGWRIEKVPKMDYWMVMTEKTDKKNRLLKKGMINGGMMKRRGEDGPVIVLQVKNIKSHVRKAEARGARVIAPPAELTGMGWYARIKDPDGNLIALWQTLR